MLYELTRMGDDKNDKNGYDDTREQILQLCKLAQGNVSTIHWCKTQIKKRLKVLDRLIERLETFKEENKNWQVNRIERIIKTQTDACKELGDKITTEIESLEAIRVASKAFGIDIKTRLLELDDTLDSSDFDDLFSEEDE